MVVMVSTRARGRGVKQTFRFIGIYGGFRKIVVPPKWMVYKGKPDLGVPLFLETSTYSFNFAIRPSDHPNCGCLFGFWPGLGVRVAAHWDEERRSRLLATHYRLPGRWQMDRRPCALINESNHPVSNRYFSKNVQWLATIFERLINMDFHLFVWIFSLSFRSKHGQNLGISSTYPIFRTFLPMCLGSKHIQRSLLYIQ